MQFYLITALVFALLVAVFAIQNTETVVIQFLAWSFSISLVLVILGSAAVGALVLYLFSLVKQIGAWMRVRQENARKAEMEKQIKRLEEQLAATQNSPKDIPAPLQSEEVAVKGKVQGEIVGEEQGTNGTIS